MKQANQDQLFNEYLHLSIDQVITKLDSSLHTGLTDAQIKKGQLRYGLNELQDAHMGLWRILVRQFSSPFIMVFIGVAIFYVLMSEYANAIIVISIVCLNTLIGLYQEYHVALNVHLLQQHLVTQIMVLRNGIKQRSAVTHLIPGDIIYLSAGDIIPADCRFIDTDNLFVDESILTGESVPLIKNSTMPQQTFESDIFQAHTIGFAGTAISSGKATAIVFATGIDTQLGRIAFISTHEMRESSLAQGTYQLARFTGKLIVGTVIMIVFLGILTQHERSLIEYIIFASALAMSVIPEALPLIVTFCLSQGASRLARKKMIVKRLSAIEDLGSIELLCTDKTGTLTENDLTAIAIDARDERAAYMYAAIANVSAYAQPTTLSGFERALWNVLTDQERANLARYTIVKEIPFDPVARKNITIIACDEQIILVMRGTVEGVLQSRIDDVHMQEWITNQEQQAHRVLAIAIRIWPQHDAPSLDQIVALADTTQLVGLIAFTDPVKTTAHTAVAQAQELGIIIKVLSGDSADVCAAVATQLGLIKDCSQVITGAEFERASTADQEQFAHTKTVFARVTPEQKYRIIHFLQQHSLVGYLGDGINDAPALKAAHVSMVLADAAAVAQQAADIIMLKKNLSTIIDGVQEGRKTFLNTLKYIKIATISNFGNFYALAIGSLVLDYLPMLPFQVLLENLLTDLPMVALATDSNDKKELRLFVQYNIKEILLVSLVLGGVNCFFHAIIFMVFNATQPAVFQTIWFTTSMLIDLLLIYSLRVRGFFLTSNPPSIQLIGLITGIGALAVGLPYTQFGQKTLQFVPLEGIQLVIIAAIATTYCISSEAVKLLYYKLDNGRATRE